MSKKKHKQQNHIAPEPTTNAIALRLWNYRYMALLFLAVVIALFIRIYYPFEHVFAGDWVRFQQNDPWHHMQLIQSFVAHFPSFPSYDVLGIHPNGLNIQVAPMFDIVVGAVAWVAGAGHPSWHMVEVIGALAPAVMGALVVIPVYFIGKTLMSRTAGVIGALLIAILPGEFLFRSLLGFTDHHAAEVLFSTVFIAFLLLALKTHRVRYSVLAGIALGVYLMSWTGGALFIFITLASLVLLYIVNHMRGEPNTEIRKTGIIMLVVALLMILPAWRMYSLWDAQVMALMIGVLGLYELHNVSVLLRERRRELYPLAVLALIVAGAIAVTVMAPALAKSVLGQLSPSGGRATISEAQGMSLNAAWEFFGPAFYVMIAALGVIGYRVWKGINSGMLLLLLVWTVVMIVAAFNQQRFAYYLAVNVAVLVGYLSWDILKLAGIETITSKQTEGVQRQ